MFIANNTMENYLFNIDKTVTYQVDINLAQIKNILAGTII
jgi:hypothetical protein